VVITVPSGLQFRKRRGFTLVEILVALAIVLLSQKNMDALGQAQLVFDRMGFDFTQMPVRDDIDYGFSKSAGNDSLSFYSATEGLYPAPSSTLLPRTISVIGYRIANDPSNNNAPVLQRGARQLDWSANGPAGEVMRFTLADSVTGQRVQKLDSSTANNTLPLVDPASSGTSNYQIFADQVFRMEICYLIKGDPSLGTQPVLQTTPPAKLSSLSAIVVAIAVLDSKSRVIVTDYTKLIAALDDPQDADLQAGKDILALWSATVNSANGVNFAQKAGIPVQAAQNVRIFQRYFYLE
jgi:prepilin-type N-terminal cleavage/methylation domain-containing protein